MERLDAIERHLACLAERVRAPEAPVAPAETVLTVDEFVAEMGRLGMRRSADWLYDQIRRRRVRTLPLGKPYRLPRSELLRMCSTK
jgi:hypothetical protein